MRNYIQIIETLFRDPQMAKSQFNIYTTANDHPAVLELLKRKGIVAHETPAKSKIGKITLTIEGTNYLYDELERDLKMAALSGTNLSVYRAPRAGDEIKESDENPWANLEYPNFNIHKHIERTLYFINDEKQRMKHDRKLQKLFDDDLEDWGMMKHYADEGDHKNAVAKFWRMETACRDHGTHYHEHADDRNGFKEYVKRYTKQVNESDAKPWNSLAGMKDGAVCTCSDAQLATVGCDCEAEQNLPVNCENCGAFLRKPEDIEAQHCKGCK